MSFIASETSNKLALASGVIVGADERSEGAGIF
jgi:hypothetical protein